MTRLLSSFKRALPLSVLLLGLTANAVLIAQTAATTTLTAAPATASTGTAVLLTATVAASGTPVTPGQVLFCDANANKCQGSAVLGTAQLLSGGTATLRRMSGIGSHSIKAIFTGTTPFLSSASSATTVAVTGAGPTSATLAFTGNAGSYTLNSTVAYQGLVPPGAAEDILFTDTSNQNLALGSAPLGTLGPPNYSFTTIASSPFASGDLPSAVVSADFNDDGIPDLAVANYTDNTVSLYTGDGIGGYTLATGSPISVGTGPSALAVADFNLDGQPDLAVVNALSGSITILLGDGTGAFHNAASISTLGNGPQSIAVADFNRDGVPDLAITNQLSSTVTVLLGDGTGLFTPTPDSPISGGGNPSSIAALDFDLDGHTDLAIANTYDSTVTILLGDGTGTFVPSSASPFAVAAGPTAVTAVDFDGDGRTDLAIASATGDTLSILLNKVGGAAFAPGSPFATGSSPSSLVVGDFNGDGAQDVAIANANSSDVTLLLNDGSGEFTPAAQSPLSGFNAPSAIALADIDGNGRQDLVVANVGVDSISLRPQQVTQTASASLAALSIFGGGTHLVTANYPGDTSYAASVSNTVSLTGSPISTNTALSISPSLSVAYRATAQLTASISPAASQNYTATGSIIFTADATSPLGSSTVTNGQAAVSVNALPVGQHSVSAAYAGDSNFSPSAVTGTFTIVQAGTVTRLSTSTTSGFLITLTATVSAATSGTPTGTISFLDGTNAQPLGTVALASGTASLSVANLSPGTHSITAVYLGDSNYSGSTSNAVNESIADFSLKSNTPAQTILPGASVDFTITATPTGTFDSPITFTVSDLPRGATASFQPSAVTPGSSPVNLVLTIATTRQTALLHTLAPAGWIMLSLLFLPWYNRNRQHRGLLRLALLSAVVCGILAGTIGCARSNGFFAQPAKSYRLVVTGTSGALHHTTAVVLTVE